MSGAANTTTNEVAIPEFKQIMGHPAPLWMLFMTEFWERFAFYGIRWALVLYIVAQFYSGSGVGEGPAGLIYGAYLALVYAGAVFGGLVADRVIGYALRQKLRSATGHARRRPGRSRARAATSHRHSGALVLP